MAPGKHKLFVVFDTIVQQEYLAHRCCSEVHIGNSALKVPCEQLHRLDFTIEDMQLTVHSMFNKPRSVCGCLRRADTSSLAVWKDIIIDLELD